MVGSKRFAMPEIGIGLFPLFALIGFITLFGPTRVVAQNEVQNEAQNNIVSSEPAIVLSAENSSIYIGDTLVLEINSTGLIEPIDVTPLFKKTTFSRETFGTKIGVSKGKVVEIALRRIEVIPQEEGLLVLGPLRGESNEGNVSSNSIAVTVAAAPDENWVPADDDLKLTMEISKPNPFVSEQFELTVQLQHRYALASEVVSLPAFDGFDVVPIMEERRLVDNTTNMRSTTWRYLLHAQRSGPQTLPGVKWSATLIRSRLQRHDFSLEADPIEFNVRAVPDKFPENTWWLAAESVTLNDEWSADLLQLSAGDELTRTINLNATGVLSNHLPVVKPLATRSFHSTPLPTQRSDELIAETTNATGIYEFRMIAEAPVSVFLDTVRVPWFNTRTREIEEAIIPSRRIDVGLPKRPDQLAELAIRRHSLNKLTLWLRSISVVNWLILTGTLLLIAVVLSFSNLRRLRRVQISVKRFFRRLEWHYWVTTGQWLKLYDALLRTPSPFDSSRDKSPLLHSIGHSLFAPSKAPAPAPSPTTSPQPDVSTAIKNRKRLWKEYTQMPAEDDSEESLNANKLPSL